MTYDGPYQGVREAKIDPPLVRARLPILVAAKGERMLRLTAELADQWQTAWFGLPDERYRGRRQGLDAALEAAGRDPATIEITVGMPIQSASIVWLVETGWLRSARDPRRYLMPKYRSRP